MGRMPKYMYTCTRAAASDAVSAEVDSGDAFALAPKGGETFEAEFGVTPEVSALAVGAFHVAPYFSFVLGLVIALIVVIVLGAERSGHLKDRDVAGIVFEVETLGVGTWSGGHAVSIKEHIRRVVGHARCWDVVRRSRYMFPSTNLDHELLSFSISA